MKAARPVRSTRPRTSPAALRPWPVFGSFTSSSAAVLAALDEVKDPKTGQGLSAAGLVRGLVLRTGRAAFMLEVPPADVELYRPVREAAEQALAAVPDVETAQVVLTAEAAPAAPYR